MNCVTIENKKDSSSYILNLRCEINHLLISIGIPVYLKGFTYLEEAVFLNVENSDRITGRKLYYRLSDIFNATPISIEKSINYAIAFAWKNSVSQLNLAHSLFSLKPCATTFIKTLAEYFINTINCNCLKSS